jgi:hypothetical protein
MIIKNPPKPRRGVMCLIAFEHELGSSADGAKIYPSMSSHQQNHKSTHACGAVEVEINMVRIVAEPDGSDDRPSATRSAEPRSKSDAKAQSAPDADGWYAIENITPEHKKLVVWAFNGNQARMKYLDLESVCPGGSLWIYADELLSDADPEPPQPTHYRLRLPDPKV